jgi:septal ring factor EnvC (AmiA/AmiB activator)
MSVDRSKPVSKTGYKTVETSKPAEIKAQQEKRVRENQARLEAQRAKERRIDEQARKARQKRIEENQRNAPKGYSG